MNRLVPELDVSDLALSLAFYVGQVGFEVTYDRPEERFAFLELEGAQLMLEEAAGPGRRFRNGVLERPFGRGVNFQIAVADAGSLCARLVGAGLEPFLPLEERWYRRGQEEAGVRQFAIADPDGYLLRFASDLGRRPAPP